jgi:asparagine synthetase B (glutamine-hydrolysing)
MQKFLVHYSSDDNEILTEGFEESSFGQFFWMNNGITENNIPPNLLSNDDVAKELIKIKEEFFYSFMANDKKAITIANDFFGKNIVYYYHSSSIFIASNDFWEVVRTLNRKSTIIINNEFIKQTTIFNISLSEDTIVTGIKTLPPASYLEFTQNKFSISKYDEIKFTPNLNLDLDTIVNKSYLLFKSFFNQLKVHKKGAVFGVGLSGGQDSRMIASMALDSGLQLAPFCIGEKKKV